VGAHARRRSFTRQRVKEEPEMNRRHTSVALLVGAPAAAAGAAALLAQQAAAQQPAAGPVTIPVTADLVDRATGQPAGTFQGTLTDCVLAVVDGPDGKQLQLEGTLSGQGTNPANQAQPVAAQKVTGVLTPEGAPTAQADLVLPAIAPLAPAAQATAAPTAAATPAATAPAGTPPTPAPASASCQILLLTIPGGLFLDLLGLQVLLQALRLDVLGARGPGALLANLLCSVTGLLNGINLGNLLSGLGNLGAGLGQLQALLGNLQSSLGGLLSALNGLLGGGLGGATA
jgi:hypothetical protein